MQPLSLSQVAFMHVLLEGTRDLIVGVGPTGSGKTRLAIAAGLSAVASGQVKKFVATRPHIMEPGEEITASIRSETSNDFQLKPLEDELRSLLGHAEVQRRKDLEQIEILPLGHMRGRTFDDAFIVIDEAQNLTIRKMRTAVTRLGRGSRMVVVGNPQQIDLHEEEPSGLPHLLGMLSESDVAHVFEFEGAHIVRNDTVAQLEALYARTDMPRARVA
ncbi:MAG: PhoH family protein [Hyphomonadaceae bacterium]